MLVLASASPRRRELLATIGFDFDVVPADVDESWDGSESPRSYVDRIARSKAHAVAGRVPATTAVLAADTTVDVDGAILAKPVDDDEARRMLRSLSDRTHQVHTAVVARGFGAVATEVVTTDVTFVELSETAIDWYLSFGEHLDKAGSYGIQSAGGALVRRIDGSPSNVVGLPLAETIDVLAAIGCAHGGPGGSGRPGRS